MSKEQFMQKITSRKFWIALTTIVVGVIQIIAPEGDNSLGTASMIFSTIAYVLAEAMVDSNRKEITE